MTVSILRPLAEWDVYPLAEKRSFVVLLQFPVSFDPQGLVAL
jgi:hypothetical protein